MSKRKLQFCKGEYYHVMNRTSSGTELFKDDKDYKLFLEKMYFYAEDCKIRIIAVTLMPTHYHIILKQNNNIGVDKFIHRLSISYTWHYRKRYKHHGSIFGSRFTAVLIVDSQQMRTVCSYVHANAWKAGLVDNPLEWDAGNLSLFYSKDFWDENQDPFLLEAFSSNKDFKNFFNAYLQINPPIIITKKSIFNTPKSKTNRLDTG